jgi:starch phosphorylase
MSHNGPPAAGASWTFTGTIPCKSSGQYGYAVRVLPRHKDLSNPFEPGLVCWG